MHLVTIATHSDAYLPYLKKSCRRHHSKLVVLGWGQKWPGYSFKSKLMKEYLKDIADDEVVCVIDSFDVILLRPVDELESAFRTYSELTGMTLIVGCDKPPSFMVRSIASVQFGTCHGLLLNAGTYIGYAKDIRTMIDEVFVSPDLDDQVLLVKYVQQHPHSVHIDTSSIFFLTINNPTGDFVYDKDIIRIQDQKLYYRGIRPFFAHGNGNTNMNTLITQLEYEISSMAKTAIETASFFTKLRKIWEYYYPQIIGVVIMLAIYIILWLRRKSKSV